MPAGLRAVILQRHARASDDVIAPRLERADVRQARIDRERLLRGRRRRGRQWQGYGGHSRGCGRFTGSFTVTALAYDPNGALRSKP